MELLTGMEAAPVPLDRTSAAEVNLAALTKPLGRLVGMILAGIGHQFSSPNTKWSSSEAVIPAFSVKPSGIGGRQPEGLGMHDHNKP
jgi:hypothetical protein